MSDVALQFDPLSGAGDLALDANDFVKDDGLESAVLLSLFTDRRAEESDVLPEGETDRRGWWADAYPVVAGDKMGSRLWLLARSKQTQETASRAEEYIREALQWLLDDKVSDQIDVEVELPARGQMSIAVTIHRPKLDPVSYHFNRTWAAQAAKEF